MAFNSSGEYPNAAATARTPELTEESPLVAAAAYCDRMA
jgi:hypothetical protein